MIKSFKCNDTEKLFNDLDVRKFRGISSPDERDKCLSQIVFLQKKQENNLQGTKIARIKLEVLHAVVSLTSLRIPPGNRLEQLKGDRKDQYSIRINDQWRICFLWKEENVYNVEIVDYHKG